MKKELDKFFKPESIAVIGATDSDGKVGQTLMIKLSEYSKKVIPINPNHEKIFGKQVYKSVSDYSEKIDLAVIVVPANLVSKVLEECGKKGIKNVIIISAGFSEIGNSEEEIKKISEKYLINFIGPNCFGIANPSENLDLTFANSSAKKGQTAFVSQSGALWSYIADLELGISKYVSLGNLGGLNFADFVEYLNQDEQTKKIVLYIESLKRNGKEFIDACKKSKKEIVVVKSGKSSRSSEATVSHTGSLATDFRIYSGAFKQAKIKHVSNLGEAFGIKTEIPKLIKEIKKISEPKVAIITNAGGAGALITDYLEDEKISVIHAPLDLIGTALANDYKKAILEEIKTKSSNIILVIFTPQTMSQSEKTAEAIIEISKEHKNKKIIACFLGDVSVRKAKELLEKNKIPCFTNCI